MDQVKKEQSGNLKPALILMIMAPLLTEVLPGATRFSALFVLPVEICMWGGGALLIRYAVRRWKLGWVNMLFLALALSIAEECLIQQTSLAPMVVQIKGVAYARAFGVNYVYLIWALIYESVFVVFLPVYFVEFILPDRKGALWINKTGFLIIIPLFIIGAFLAWYSWTQIARPAAYHVSAYNPPFLAILISVIAICVLIFLATGSIREKYSVAASPIKLPHPVILGILSGLWATLLYGLVLLGFGIDPSFPSWIPVCSGIILAVCAMLLLPRWTANAMWNPNHSFALIFGTMLGSMLVSFLGFIGQPGIDLYFKILVDVAAVIMMTMLGVKVRRKLALSRIPE